MSSDGRFGDVSGGAWRVPHPLMMMLMVPPAGAGAAAAATAATSLCVPGNVFYLFAHLLG